MVGCLLSQVRISRGRQIHPTSAHIGHGSIRLFKQVIGKGSEIVERVDEKKTTTVQMQPTEITKETNAISSRGPLSIHPSILTIH
jgi:hypothetical protein